MRFFGGFLKFLSILVMLAGTVVCTAISLEAEVIEAYLVMGGVWILIILFAMAVWFIGVSLGQLAKLKKRVEQLEQKIQNVSPMPVRTTYAPPAPVQIPEEQPVNTEAAAEEVPVQPAATPAPAAAEPEKKSIKAWMPAAIVGAVAVVAIIAVVLIMGGGKDNTGDVQMDDPGTVVGGDVYIPEEPETITPTVDAVPLSVGGVLESDNGNFFMTFDSVEIYDEYSYRTSDISTTSLWVEDGYKLLAVRGLFVNNGTQAIQDSCFHLTATVNDTYTVEGFDVSLDFERSASFEIDPYTEQSYILHLNIPEKLAASFETVTFTIGFNNDLSVPVTNWDMNGNKTVETDQLYSLTSGLTKEPTVPGEEGASAAEEMSEKAIPIGIGEVIDAGDYEFTLLNVELTYEVLPPNTSSVYVSYPAESGKVYVHVEADVKNTMQRDIRIDELFATSVIYDGKYPYTGFPIVNDGDNRFDWVGSYVAATPLETCRAHGLVECPAEVDESGNALVVYLELGDQTYEYVLR